MNIIYSKVKVRRKKKSTEWVESLEFGNSVLGMMMEGVGASTHSWWGERQLQIFGASAPKLRARLPVLTTVTATNFYVLAYNRERNHDAAGEEEGWRSGR